MRSVFLKALVAAALVYVLPTVAVADEEHHEEAKVEHEKKEEHKEEKKEHRHHKKHKEEKHEEHHE